MKKIFIPRSFGESVKSDEFIMGTAWSVPIVLKLLSINDQSIAIITILVALICFVKLILNPTSMLISLPFFTLLSPMIGFLVLPIGKVLLSDILFIVLVIQMIILFLRRKNLVNKFHFYKPYVFLTFSFIFSTFFGLLYGTLISLKPSLYLLQLLVIYFYTSTFAKNDLIKQAIINSWIFASFLGALLLIKAFISGQVLQDFALADDAIIEDKNNLEYLFRATYYYTGFIFLVGISCIILIIKVFFNNSYLKNILNLFGIIIFLLSLFLMSNKTVIFSFIIVLIILLILLIYNGYINRKKFTFLLLAISCIFFFVIIPIYFQFSNQNQYDLLLGRFKSISSFVARLEVYTTALNEWISYPIQLILGMGPDFLDGSGSSDLAINFKKSYTTGIVEGTVDSGWISYLIELGIIPFIIFSKLYYKSAKYAYLNFKFQSIRSNISPTGLNVFAGLLFTFIALLTQMLGYTKTSWLPFQLFILGFMYYKIEICQIKKC